MALSTSNWTFLWLMIAKSHFMCCEFTVQEAIKKTYYKPLNRNRIRNTQDRFQPSDAT